MKVPALCLLLALAIATDLAYRPFWSSGLATPDPPLLFLLWLAHLDRRRRVHVAVGILAALRFGFGTPPLFNVWLPLAAAVEAVMVARIWLNIRDPWVRLVPVAMGVFVHLVVQRYGYVGGGNDLPWQDVWRGSGYGVLSALILFPILDACKPVLRSYSYPL